jgi:hypothetical protein
MIIAGNMVGCYSMLGKTIIIENENGEELMGVVVDQEVVSTATDADVRKGKVYASNNGISVGTLEI